MAADSVLFAIFKQYPTDLGIDAANSLIILTRANKSERDPLLALSRTWGMKATKFEAVVSSKQGTNLVVSGNLFYSNAPSNTYCKVSLSDFN